jgi:hypothetical protein
MKKSLLIPLALFSGIAMMAQGTRYNTPLRAPSNGLIFEGNSMEVSPGTPVIPMEKRVVPPSSTPLASGIGVIAIGNESNAFGTIGNRTHLWADPSIHAITLTHRQNPFGNSGVIVYDYSKTTGHSWFTNLGPIYSPDGTTIGPHFSSARYPQGCIYNPAGNTIPDSAFEVFFASTLDGTNPPAGTFWGGHAYGSQQLGGSDTMQRQVSSNASSNTWNFIPVGMTITKGGVVYNLDENSKGNPTGTVYTLTDSLLLSKGVWNAALRHFDYVVTKIPFKPMRNLNGNSMVSDFKISFADDGRTGYISATARMSYTDVIDSAAFQMVVMKTIDAGLTWSAPVTLDVNAVDFLMLGDGSNYGAGFEHDAVVDGNNNLHIIVNVNKWNQGANQGSFSYYAAYQAGNLGIFDLYTKDGGITWYERLLAKPNLFQGTFGSTTDVNNPQIGEYNRPQASRTYTNGNKLFFSWFDTDTTSGLNPAASGNVAPDFWSIGYDITTNLWTAPKNFTAGSGTIADGDVRQGMVSYYVFDSAGTYTVPAAFVSFANNDPGKTGVPEQLYYIDKANFTDADFSVTNSGIPMVLGIKEYQNKNLSVSQNYPNPFSSLTNIDVTLQKSTDLTVEVTNLLGQTVYSQQSKSLNAGTHTYTIDGANLGAGIYFYTIRTNETSVTQKMMVK